MRYSVLPVACRIFLPANQGKCSSSFARIGMLKSFIEASSLKDNTAAGALKAPFFSLEFNRNFLSPGLLFPENTSLAHNATGAPAWN